MRLILLALFLVASTMASLSASAVAGPCTAHPVEGARLPAASCSVRAGISRVGGGGCDVSFNPQPDPPGEPFVGCQVATPVATRVGLSPFGCEVMFNPQPDPPIDWCRFGRPQ